MPGTYSFVGRLLRITVVDKTSLPELERLLDQALSDPKCTPPVFALIDVRRATSVRGRSPDEIAEAVHFFAERSDHFEKFAVVTTYGARFAVTQAAEAFGESEGLEFGVFTEEATASDWLRGSEPESA